MMAGRRHWDPSGPDAKVLTLAARNDLIRDIAELEAKVAAGTATEFDRHLLGVRTRILDAHKAALQTPPDDF